ARESSLDAAQMFDLEPTPHAPDAPPSAEPEGSPADTVPLAATNDFVTYEPTHASDRGLELDNTAQEEVITSAPLAEIAQAAQDFAPPSAEPDIPLDVSPPASEELLEIVATPDMIAEEPPPPEPAPAAEWTPDPPEAPVELPAPQAEWI